MLAESRGAGAGGGTGCHPSTAPHQLPSEPLLALCDIRKYLSPALGFNFLSVSLKVPLTGYPGGLASCSVDSSALTLTIC